MYKLLIASFSFSLFAAPLPMLWEDILSRTFFKSNGITCNCCCYAILFLVFPISCCSKVNFNEFINMWQSLSKLVMCTYSGFTTIWHSLVRQSLQWLFQWLLSVINSTLDETFIRFKAYFFNNWMHIMLRCWDYYMLWVYLTAIECQAIRTFYIFLLYTLIFSLSSILTLKWWNSFWSQTCER